MHPTLNWFLICLTFELSVMVMVNVIKAIVDTVKGHSELKYYTPFLQMAGIFIGFLLLLMSYGFSIKALKF